MDETQTTGTNAPTKTVDTVEDQNSEASLQVDNVAPEAAQVEEPTVKATDTADDKLYAGKYKSVEEMEKAYLSAQTKLTETASEKAELSRILNESFGTEEPQAQTVEADLFTEPDVVKSELENVKRSQAVMMFVMNHQDADPKTMQEVLSSDPLVKQIQGHEAKLEYAYLRSQSMSQNKAIAEATKTGAQQAQAKIVEKQAAQVETAQQSAAPIDEKAELKERMQSGPLADREAARKAYIKKYLI